MPQVEDVTRTARRLVAGPSAAARPSACHDARRATGSRLPWTARGPPRVTTRPAVGERRPASRRRSPSRRLAAIGSSSPGARREVDRAGRRARRPSNSRRMCGATAARSRARSEHADPRVEHLQSPARPPRPGRAGRPRPCRSRRSSSRRRRRAAPPSTSALGRAEPARATLDQVARERERRAGEADQRHGRQRRRAAGRSPRAAARPTPSGSKRPRRSTSAIGADRVARSRDRRHPPARRRRPIPRSGVVMSAKRIAASTPSRPHRLERDLGAERRRPPTICSSVARLADAPVFGQRATRLAHEPDRRRVRRAAGDRHAGTGRGHARRLGVMSAATAAQGPRAAIGDRRRSPARVCASDRNHASNGDGGRSTPARSMARKKRAERARGPPSSASAPSTRRARRGRRRVSSDPTRAIATASSGRRAASASPFRRPPPRARRSPRAARRRRRRARPASAIPAAMASGCPGQRPGLVDRTVRRDERHQVRAAAVRPDGHAAADDLAEHRQVGPDPEARLRAAAGRPGSR